MEMRKIMLVAAALTAGAIGLNGTAAQQTQQQGSEGEMKVTGMVTEADQETKEITIGDKTFVMSDQAGTAMFPQVGAEVTVFYEEQDGKNVITRIGQAPQ
jgi:Cu/Ag efflux protein CusF